MNMEEKIAELEKEVKQIKQDMILMVIYLQFMTDKNTKNFDACKTLLFYLIEAIANKIKQ